MQHAPGPRFHHRQPAPARATPPSSSASDCPRAASSPCPGAENENVIDGMDFLRAFNAGTPLPLGKRIIVIGGGNVAYDVARSAVRPHDEHVAYDVARSALRLSRRQGSPRGLPGKPRRKCPPTRSKSTKAPRKASTCTISAGRARSCSRTARLTGLRTVRCTAVFDAGGRFNPTFDEAQVEDIPADSIIFAIGQTSDLSFLDPADGVESERGLIKVNRETYQTTAPGRLRLRRYRARRAPLHRCHRQRPDRRAFDARFSARHAHRSRGAQAVVARHLHDGGKLERAAPRESARRSKARSAPPRSRSWKWTTKRTTRAGRPPAACAATSTPSSTRRSAWPATAAWTCARRA